MMQGEDVICQFLDTGSRFGCAIHEDRPTQCRTFPFWPETLKSREAWDALKSICPGIDVGELHSRETIEASAAHYEGETALDGPGWSV
jgi:Fe-S-cluster containining protein